MVVIPLVFSPRLDTQGIAFECQRARQSQIELDWLNQSSSRWTLILGVKEIHRDRSGLDRVARSPT